MKKIFLFTFIFSIALINGTIAQNKHLRKAKRYEYKGDYVKALTSYQLYLENNKSDISVYKKLTDLSCKMDDYDSAEMYCEELINKNLADPDTYFNYIKILRRNAKYDKSQEVFEEFKNLFPNEIYKYYRNFSLPNRKSFYLNANNINIYDFQFNTVNSEFAPFISGKDIFFTNYDNGNNRTKPTTKVEKFINEYITPFKPTYTIHKAKADTLSMTYTLKPFNKLFNSSYHEGIASVSPSGEIMYISAANKNEKISFNHSITGFDIYEARLIDNEWNITQKIFDIPGKSFAHPCINRQSNMLYFASDIDGGYGGTDLYVSYLINGKWSEPENLGPEINTPGNELYPFVDKDNILYFSSDGHPGMGGLDIFVISINNEKVTVYNAGAPINSRFDDYGISCFDNKLSGLFSSNRPGGLGEHDIYTFQAKEPLNILCKSAGNSSVLGFFTIKGEIVDMYTNKPINNAKLILKDMHGTNSNYNTTTINGKFTYIIPIDGEYELTFSASGYKTTTNKLTSGKKYFTIDVEPELIFPDIKFDYNSSNITEEGKNTLNDIIDCLFKYPKTKILIEGYADIISEGKENKKLSQERTISIQEFLENKGIAKDRITTKSFGTKDPIITLDDKLAFEKEDAQSVNRRVEITIIHPPLNSIKN
jgi:outer membrane protein OmpA-like peptidoglycan-associated protein/tetratricopeptide (TPR) repeat protein